MSIATWHIHVQLHSGYTEGQNVASPLREAGQILPYLKFKIESPPFSLFLLLPC